MRRAFFLIAAYAVIGTVLTLGIYRIVLGGPFYAISDRSLDSLVIFLGVMFNTLLGFAAAGVAAAMVGAAAPGFAVTAGISALVAGVVSLMMTLWFSGLTWMFPLTMTGMAVICAAVARVAGWLGPEPPHPQQP